MNVKMFDLPPQKTHLVKPVLEPREDKRVRELISHIGPIPILIPLKLFSFSNKIQISKR